MTLFHIQKPREKIQESYSFNIGEMANNLADRIKKGFTPEEFNALEFKKQLRLLGYKRKSFGDARDAAETFTPGLLVGRYGSHTTSHDCGLSSGTYTTYSEHGFYVGERGLLLQATIKTPMILSRKGDSFEGITITRKESKERILHLDAVIDAKGAAHHKYSHGSLNFVETFDGPVTINKQSSDDGVVYLTGGQPKHHYYGTVDTFYLRPKLNERMLEALQKFK